MRYVASVQQQRNFNKFVHLLPLELHSNLPNRLNALKTARNHFKFLLNDAQKCNMLPSTIELEDSKGCVIKKTIMNSNGLKTPYGAQLAR